MPIEVQLKFLRDTLARWSVEHYEGKRKAADVLRLRMRLDALDLEAKALSTGTNALVGWIKENALDSDSGSEVESARSTTRRSEHG